MKQIVNFNLLILILLISFFVRFDKLSEHFTHVDDIGFAKTIMDTRTIKFSDNVFNQENPSYSSSLKTNLRSYVNDPNDNIYKILNTIYPYFIGTLLNTTAPINPILINYMLPKDPGYEELKFWGRIPSFFFNFVSILLFVYLLFKIYSYNKIELIIAPLIIFTFSLEHIIIAKLMHNFSIAPFCAILCLIFLISKQLNIDRFSSNIKFSILISLLVLFHYQSFILIISYFLIDLIYNLKNNDKKIIYFYKLFKKYILVFFFTLPFYLWIKYRSFVSFSWNAGPNNEFVFFNINNLRDAFNFYIDNSVIVFSRILSFTSETNIERYYLGEIILFFFISGLLSSILIKSKNIKKISLFIFIFFVVNFVLISINQLAFSPTRHSAIFIPFLIFIINNNIVYLKQRLNIKFFNSSLTYFNIAFFLIVFYFFNIEYKIQMEKREDLFNETQLNKILNDHKVDRIIIYDWTYNTMFMKSINDKYTHDNLKFIPLLSNKNNNKVIDKYNLKNLDLSEDKSVMFISGVFRLPYNKKNLNINNEILPNKDYSEYFQEIKLFLDQKLSEWIIVEKIEKINLVELEFSRLTENTSNNIFIYIFKKKIN